jgi:hypothetical protein
MCAFRSKVCDWLSLQLIDINIYKHWVVYNILLYEHQALRNKDLRALMLFNCHPKFYFGHDSWMTLEDLVVICNNIIVILLTNKIKLHKLQKPWPLPFTLASTTYKSILPHTMKTELKLSPPLYTPQKKHTGIWAIFSLGILPPRST